MTFANQETSRADGQPIEVYDFTLGLQTFSYTSGATAVAVGGTTYQPAAISRSSVTLGSESRQNILTVSMPSSLSPADEYIAIAPGQRGFLTIRRFHSTDPDAVVDNIITIFKGVVRSVGYIDDGYRAELQIVPLTAGLGREAPRFTFQGLCNHFLYDVRCKVVQANFDFTGPVTSVVGNIITLTGANAQADGFYTGGFIQRGTTDFRMIVAHTGNTLEVILPFPSDVTGEDLTIFAGCDHTIATCKSKFDNVINYGGHAFVPLRDIFVNGIR